MSERFYSPVNLNSIINLFTDFYYVDRPVSNFNFNFDFGLRSALWT